MLASLVFETDQACWRSAKTLSAKAVPRVPLPITAYPAPPVNVGLRISSAKACLRSNGPNHLFRDLVPPSRLDLLPGGSNGTALDESQPFLIRRRLLLPHVCSHVLLRDRVKSAGETNEKLANEDPKGWLIW